MISGNEIAMELFAPKFVRTAIFRLNSQHFAAFCFSFYLTRNNSKARVLLSVSEVEEGRFESRWPPHLDCDGVAEFQGLRWQRPSNNTGREVWAFESAIARTRHARERAAEGARWTFLSRRPLTPVLKRSTSARR